jgi:hypothetical protein
MIIYVVLEKKFEYDDNYYMLTEDFITANKSFTEKQDAINYINTLNKKFIKDRQDELRSYFHYEMENFNHLNKDDHADTKNFFQLFRTNNIYEIDNNLPEFSEKQLEFLVEIFDIDIYQIQEIELCNIFS